MTGVLLVWFDDESVAIATSAWLPALNEPVLMDPVYGAEVPTQTTLPSRRSTTLATPTLSAAVMLTAVVAPTVEPFAGDVIETVGGVTSSPPWVTVSVMGALVVVLVAASFATAFTMWSPAVNVAGSTV